MSIDAAIGRIAQILTLQQQITDPGAAGTGASTTSAASTTAGSATASPSDFASMLASAQGTSFPTSTSAADSTGLTSATALPTTASSLASASPASLASILGADSGSVSPDASSQVQAMVQTANSLVGKPYVYGGGHSGWGPQTGYDCSGFVSAVLHAGGYLSAPADTVTLPSQAGIEQGPGQYVTIYDRTGAGQDGHVIIDIGGQFYESGGESASWGGGGGVEKIGTPSAAYLATFDAVLHPSGL